MNETNSKWTARSVAWRGAVNAVLFAGAALLCNCPLCEAVYVMAASPILFVLWLRNEHHV